MRPKFESISFERQLLNQLSVELVCLMPKIGLKIQVEKIMNVRN